jgi:Effector Associated Constant Component 1
MADQSIITLHIAFHDPALDAEERETEVHKLLYDLQQLDEVEEVARVRDPHPPEGSKAIGAFLTGLLQVGVTAPHVTALLGYLRNRLAGKSIEIEVEAHGKKLKVTANTQAELHAAVAAARQFVMA